VPTSWRRPRIPAAAAGLVAATKAWRRRDREPLMRWQKRARPLLVQALERAGMPRFLADEAVLAFEEAAVLAATEGRRVGNELAWMATIAERTWRGWVETTKKKTVATEAADPVELLAEREDRLRQRGMVRRALAALPQRYRDLLRRRHLAEQSLDEVAEHARLRWGIGLAQVRKYLREGRKMLDYALRGGDPRRRWPRRYRSADEKTRKKGGRR